MKGVSRNDISLSLFISISYFIFWSLVIFISGSGDLSFFSKAIIPYSWQILFVTTLNLFIHLLALPFIRSRRTKWRWNLLLIIILLLLFIGGFTNWNKIGELISIIPQPKSRISNMDAEVKNILFQLFGLGYFASIKFFVDSYKLKLSNQQLDIEKKTSELNYLKSQTNPHFLFNTLNNIYSLTRDKSDSAPVSVLRLSDILRYMLYEIEEEKVFVEKEIKVINDYIELERIRYDETLTIKFTVEADNLQQEVPPLLMIPLIENAFKHGVSETADMPFIQIHLVIKNGTLHLTVENSIGKINSLAGVKENIGLRNLRRQLELQFTTYQFFVEQKEKTFFVSMYINLNSYAKNQVHYY